MNAGRSVVRDLSAGFVAILAVVGVSVRSSFVGSDMRALFAVTSLAFYLAGVARGGDRRWSVWPHGLVVSSPGLLGTAALIMNDGLHRLPIPIAVSLTAILFTIAGLQTRRWWTTARTRALVLALACVGAGALEVALVHDLVAGASLHRVDRPAPDFALATFGGDTLRSSAMRGKVIVLAYWASWCLPCGWEMPELDAAYAAIGRDSTVVFLAVDAGWGGETPARGRRYLERRGFRAPAAFDDGDAARALGVHALPTVLFIDRSGRVRFEHYGFDRSEHVASVYVRCIRSLQRGGRS